MCGIAGILSSETGQLKSSIKSMNDAISHRGPDGEGFFINEEDGIAFGHRRLSIIDLTHEASQPMRSRDDRYQIIFNGEIYNYIEIKQRLEKQGIRFYTSSDTEVLLTSYILNGPKCLDDFDGMFAFAIWDSLKKQIFCARDRFGEKPFFYVYEPHKYFCFASEIKALKTLGAKFHNVNHAQLYNFLAFGYVNMPDEHEQTFYSQINKLPAGYCATISKDIIFQKKPYWQLEMKANSSISFNQAAEQFAEFFSTSIKRRMRSDVPIGSSLSGGLDSSIIVCLINSFNKDLSIKQNIFSAKFPGFEKDESKYIDIVVKHTSVNPHFTYPSEDGFLNAFEKLSYFQDEPFGSASIFAQWEVMRLAKENNVTVLLDGQGADEILAGYHQYYTNYFQELFLSDRFEYKKQWNHYIKLQASPIHRDFKFYAGIYLKDQKKHFGWFKDIVNNKFKDSFNKEFYKKNKKHSKAKEIKTLPSLNYELYKSVTDGRLETLLRIADRNSMAHSREVRLPFLSHLLVEFLFTLPAEFKIHNGWTKFIARKSFENLVPNEIVWRKDKIGYEPPQKKWMQHPKVKEYIVYAKELLVKERILDRKVLQQDVVANSASDRGNNSWNYLMAGKLLGL